jgi:hypothetical protein
MRLVFWTEAGDLSTKYTYHMRLLTRDRARNHAPAAALCQSALLCDCPALNKMGGECVGATRHKEQSVLPHGRVIWRSCGNHLPAAARREGFVATGRGAGFTVGARPSRFESTMRFRVSATAVTVSSGSDS